MRHDDETPQDQLFRACEAGLLEEVKEALANGASINEQRDFNLFTTAIPPILHLVMWTPRLSSSRALYLDLLQYLLDQGADPDLIGHPYRGFDVSARSHAKEEDPELFAIIERHDLAGSGQPPARGKRDTL